MSNTVNPITALNSNPGFTTSLGGSGSQTSNTSASQSANSLNQKDFLTLLAAQAQNQNPLDAESSASGDYLSQLSQFSTNSSINQMNESIQQLVSSLQSDQALQASSLVGKNVLVNSNVINLGSDGTANAAINVQPGMTNLVAKITDANGNLIDTIPLGQQEPGIYSFNWKGTDANKNPVPPGNYNISVTTSYNDSTLSVPTMTSATVNSVTLPQNGNPLLLNLNGIGAFTLSSVQQIG